MVVDGDIFLSFHYRRGCSTLSVTKVHKSTIPEEKMGTFSRDIHGRINISFVFDMDWPLPSVFKKLRKLCTIKVKEKEPLE